MELALQAGAVLAEGPRWDARIERLLWVDIDGKALHRFDPATGEDEAWPMPAKVGAAAATEDPDRVLVALADRLAIFDVRSGELEPLADFPHGPDVRTNDGSVDPSGRFWVGTMADDTTTPDRGALYRFANGGLTTVLEPISLSNGLGWIGDRMYYVDTPTKRIDVMDYDGDVSNRRPWVHVEEGVGSPDGLVIDDEGGVWLALYGGAQVRRYDEAGKLDQVLPVPADNVTACWFAGNRLFVTTAASPQPLGGSLFVAEPGVSGPAARIFAG